MDVATGTTGVVVGAAATGGTAEVVVVVAAPIAGIDDLHEINVKIVAKSQTTHAVAVTGKPLASVVITSMMDAPILGAI